MLKNLMNPTSKIPHLQIIKPSVHRTHRRTRNANKRAGSGGKKPKFRSEGGGIGIRVGEVGVRYERAVEISRFRRRPCSEIYIFGAKGEKEGRKKKREEGEGERIFFVDPGPRRTKPAKDSPSPFVRSASINGRRLFRPRAESRFRNALRALLSVFAI